MAEKKHRSFNTPFSQMKPWIVKKEIEKRKKEKITEEEKKEKLKKEKLQRIKREGERLKKAKERKAYLVTFKSEPDLLYVSFNLNRDKAVWDACKYFGEEMHVSFQNDARRTAMLRESHAKRIPEFDIYENRGRIPAPKFMEVLNVQFKCSFCGKGFYSYGEYKSKRCFYIEGEGNINKFVEGLIMCHHCYKKYILGEDDK